MIISQIARGNFRHFDNDPLALLRGWCTDPSMISQILGSNNGEVPVEEKAVGFIVQAVETVLEAILYKRLSHLSEREQTIKQQFEAIQRKSGYISLVHMGRLIRGHYCKRPA